MLLAVAVISDLVPVCATFYLLVPNSHKWARHVAILNMQVFFRILLSTSWQYVQQCPTHIYNVSARTYQQKQTYAAHSSSSTQLVHNHT